MTEDQESQRDADVDEDVFSEEAEELEEIKKNPEFGRRELITIKAVTSTGETVFIKAVRS